MIYLQLFYEFFKIGLFAVGGGMATLPFLQRLSESTGWYPQSLITDMIAISEATPGPIGINMATYVGYNVAGIGGALVATLGEVLPALFIVVIVYHELEKFRSSTIVKDAFYGLRPAVTGLIAAAGINVITVSFLHVDLFAQTGLFADLLDIKKAVFFVLVYIGIRKFKLHPILYIAAAAVVGLLAGFWEAPHSLQNGDSDVSYFLNSPYSIFLKFSL